MNRKSTLLTVIGLLITYGSLYPFDFSPPAGGAWQRLMSESAAMGSRGDSLGNIALFIPWGLVGMLALAAKQAGLRTFVLGFALALAVQIVQIWIPSRTPALYDVGWNMLGCAIGVILGGHVDRHWHRLAGGRQPLAFWLLVAWVLVEWLPLVPSLDWQLVKQQVKGLLVTDALDAGQIALRFAVTLLLGELIDRSWRPPSGRRASVWLLPLLAAGVLAGKLMLVGTQLNASAVAGYGAGVVGWWLLTRASAERRTIVVITALVLAYSLSALLPFSLRAMASPFDFMPFSGLLSGSMLENARALASSLLLFFSVLFLLRDGGAKTMASAIALAIWVLLLECLQMFIASRSASITEPLLALIAGVLLANVAVLASEAAAPAKLASAPSPAPWRRTAMIGNKILAGAIAVILIVAGLKILLGLPSIPYNVAELFWSGGSLSALLSFALALLWAGAGAAWLGQRLARSAQPALWFVPATVIVAVVSLALLQTSVTGESIRDIVGAPDHYRSVVNENIWGNFWRTLFLRLDTPALIGLIETYVRYWALYTPLAASLGLTIYARAQTAALGRVQAKAAQLVLAIIAGLTLWLCKAITFDCSATDNLTELIARDADWSHGLGLGGGTFLYALLVLISLNAVLLSGVRLHRPGRLAGAVVGTIIAIPAGWWLLNIGLDQHVEKYGQVFSGVQFLLGPDRTHALSEIQLFARWSAVQAAGTFVLAFGLWLGRRPTIVQNSAPGASNAATSRK